MSELMHDEIDRVEGEKATNVQKWVIAMGEHLKPWTVWTRQSTKS